MRRTFPGIIAAGAALTLVAAGSFATSTAQAGTPAQDRVTAEERDSVTRQLLAAGLQTARKHATLPQVKVDGRLVNRANPYLAQIADPTTIDWSYWHRFMARKSAQQARLNGRAAPPAAVAYDEQEPDGTFGTNDTLANAERITGVGANRNKKAVRIIGSLSQPSFSFDDITTTEDQGAIPIATDTGIGSGSEAVTVSSEIGDGPYGSGGTDTGDFDFFHVEASAGEVVRGSTAGSDFDTLLVVYDATGVIVDGNDDSNGTLQSEISYRVPADGDYYVMVSGYAPFGGIPEDPFDSSSGTGSGAEGEYDLDLSVGGADADYYAVRMNPGDVVGGNIEGSSADVVVTKFDGDPRIGSRQDASFIYPTESPLPGGGNASFGYVAEEAGWYGFSTSDGSGDYRMLLEFYHPGSQTAGADVTQTIFLDFDGERVNTGIFGGAGVRNLSPLSTFLAAWGLPRSDLNKVINRTVKTVKENVEADLIAQGLNDNVSVNVLNSRDDEDPWGEDNVSRVIVGGTIAQSGVDTIGIAQSIDPGNYGHEETALVLLDILSGDPDEWGDASLNFYITAASNKIKFIATALGNVTSHEIGHYVGSFHVDQFNDTLNLMDQGGNFPLLYGVGDDLVGGTADDPDVDFGVDDYNPGEGFTGLENTLNNSAWAFVLGS